MKSFPTLLLPVLPICALSCSCESSDMEMLGALAAGTASSMASSTGDTVGAATMAKVSGELIESSTNDATASDSSATNPPAATTAKTSSSSSEIWHDELTIKEVVSGKVTPYDGHETNIPGDVVASKMGSAADANALWGPQGGTVISYSRSGRGLNETITVVVKFRDVIDTHVFKRDN